MSVDHQNKRQVCGALGCHKSDDVQIVNTKKYGRRALCNSHRQGVEEVA